ncbi:phage tail protein [Aliarcobacter butzleri]|uniref:phage tail protein n=1 Tax=Aliarcobacter butzleri TaxID=28197 RepID=UPI003AFA946E
MTNTQYYSLLTSSGHQANIKAKALGLPIVISKVAFGSGNITPTESATALVKEEIRVNINSIIQNETDKNILEIEAVIPSDVGGFLVNEAALYLEDGTLYAVANLPASYKPSLDQGAGKEFAFTIFLASVGVENITLKIDDSIVFATRKYVLSELKKYALINGDETKRFKVADAVELNEAINKKQLEALQKSVNDAISNIQTLPIGAILTGYTIFNNCIVAFGGEFNRADYPKLWAYLQANPSLVKTQAQWQSEATANGGICGFFSDGNGMTTFRVPNLDKAFLRPDSRSIASYEKGTLYTYDTSNDQSVLGDTIWHSSTKRVGSNSQVDIGVDDFNISQYPNVGACGNLQSVEVGLPTSGARYFAGSTRPKNIAILPLIVAK